MPARAGTPEMPTYEYRCNACGHTMEAFQSIKARALKKCPACEKLKLERLISGGGAIIFKGSGFYETDYRSKDYTQKAEADKKASSGGDEKKSDSKSDSTSGEKAASKTETKPEKKTDPKPAGKPNKKAQSK